MPYDHDEVQRILRRTDPAMITRLVGMLPRQIAIAEADQISPEASIIPETELEASFLQTAPGSLRLAPEIGGLSKGIRGPLVRADQPNLNGALFRKMDLAFGLPSLVGAPVVINHRGGAYGWVSTAELLEQADLGPYVDITSRIWADRFGDVWDSVVSGVADGSAAFSMECVASAIGCQADGCGVVTSRLETACAHILNRTAPRLQIEPTFYGASLVLPPETPGWPDARVSLD